VALTIVGEVTSILRNLKKFIIFVFNIILSSVVLFSVRRTLLAAVGCKVGAGTTIHRSVKIFDFGKLIIGKNSTINPDCLLDNRGGLSIGDNVNISHRVSIYTMGHDVDDSLCPVFVRSVCVENNAWIFPNVLIMPGVRVGEGAVIYPGSVVTKDVERYTIVGGNPAKRLRERRGGIAYCAKFPLWFAM